MKNLYILAFGLLVMAYLSSCKSEYASYIDREMATGVKYDSTIFNLKFGEIRDTFFKKCYALNKQQLVTEGSGEEVRHKLKLIPGEDSVKAKELNFYGIFDENKIMVGMTMRYSYNAWAPWNKELQSDYLMKDVENMILEGYGGNNFIPIKIDGIKGDVLVKIDGNRRFLMYPEDPRYIRVKIDNMDYVIKHKIKK
jgi:hypothetical protein